MNDGGFTYDAMGNMLSSKIGDRPTANTLAEEAYFRYVGTTPKIATVRRTALEDPGEPIGGDPRDKGQDGDDEEVRRVGPCVLRLPAGRRQALLAARVQERLEDRERDVHAHKQEDHEPGRAPPRNSAE